MQKGELLVGDENMGVGKQRKQPGDRAEGKDGLCQECSPCIH